MLPGQHRVHAFFEKLRFFIERDNRILDGKSAALAFALLVPLSVLRYTRHWIAAALGLGGYSSIEGGYLIFIAACGFLIYSKLPRRASATAGPARRSDPPPRRDDPLLTLRASACLYVLLGHSFLIAFPPTRLRESLQNGAFYTYFLPEPWAGLWIFFTLSGYLMGKGFFFGRYTATTPSIFAFYRNRLLRIFPMYLAGTLLVAAFARPQFFYPENFVNAVNLVVFFDFAGDPRTPNGALWSIGTELEFYLFVPFLFVLLRNFFTTKLRTALAFALFFCAGLALRVLLQKSPQIFGPPFLGNFDFFLCGLTLSALMSLIKKGRGGEKRASISLFCILVFYLVSAYFCRFGRMLGEPFPKFLWLVVLPSITILFTCLVIYLMETSLLEKEWSLTGSIIRRTQFLGILTYSLYVWHEPIILAEHSFLGAQELSLSASFGLLLLNLGKVFGFAYLFYCFLERPYDAKKAIYTSPRSAAQT